MEEEDRGLGKPCFLTCLCHAGGCSVDRTGNVWEEGKGLAYLSSLLPEVAEVPEGSHVSFLTKFGQGPQQ